MAKILAKELSEICGITPKALATYKGRGKVVAEYNTSDGLNYYDTTNEFNAAFIEQKQVSNGGVPHAISIPKVKSTPKKKPTPITQPETEPEENEGSGSISSLQKKKLKLETKKLAVDIELKNIEKQKKLGQMIPTDLIRVLFMQHNKNIITSFKEHMTKALNVKVRAIGGGKRDIIDIENTIELSINESIENTLEMTKSQLENIIEDSSEKLGVGQRR